MTPDLERLRRFALAAALVLICYAAAGVELERGAKVTMFGMPFIIRTPELLPFGLILASVYALTRFYYYGFMLGHSPQRRRKELLERLHPYGGPCTYKKALFFSSTQYSTSLIRDQAAVDAQIRELIDAFPKVWRVRAQGAIEPLQSIDDDGEAYSLYSAVITIPFLCRLAALLQDLDYTAPIWLNIGALALAGVTVWR